MEGKLTPIPVIYGELIRCTTKVICSAWRGHLWVLHWIHLLFDLMDYEDLFVLLMCLLFFVARSKESRVAPNGVRVPLWCSWGEECFSKEFSVFTGIGGAVLGFPRGGRGTQNKNRHRHLSRNFEGYPVEDILFLPLNLL